MEASYENYSSVVFNDTGSFEFEKKLQESKGDLKSLPTEVIREVLSNLSMLDLGSVSQVNKFFNEMSDERLITREKSLGDFSKLPNGLISLIFSKLDKRELAFLNISKAWDKIFGSYLVNEEDKSFLFLNSSFPKNYFSNISDLAKKFVNICARSNRLDAVEDLFKNEIAKMSYLKQKPVLVGFITHLMLIGEVDLALRLLDENKSLAPVINIGNLFFKLVQKKEFERANKMAISLAKHNIYMDTRIMQQVSEGLEKIKS